MEIGLNEQGIKLSFGPKFVEYLLEEIKQVVSEDGLIFSFLPDPEKSEIFWCIYEKNKKQIWDGPYSTEESFVFPEEISIARDKTFLSSLLSNLGEREVVRIVTESCSNDEYWIARVHKESPVLSSHSGVFGLGIYGGICVDAFTGRITYASKVEKSGWGGVLRLCEFSDICYFDFPGLLDQLMYNEQELRWKQS